MKTPIGSEDTAKMADHRPLLGISSCLLGNPVRFDGGHKNNAYVQKNLADHFNFAPFCPEVAIGLPTPRKPIRLVAAEGDTTIRVVQIDDASLEYGKQLARYADKVSAGLGQYCGYILKKDSPSCGMERVKVYEKENAPPVRRGVGAYAARLMQQRPELPIEEEGRLMDPGLRENFITRVFTLFRWREMNALGLTKSRLVEFHTRHKFLLLAHHEVTYRELGKVIANLSNQNLEELASEYLLKLMNGLKHKANPNKHANVLMHIMGFFKDKMSADDKAELLELIEAHRTGMVPVIVPITLVNHYSRKFPHEYIARQYYLEPHPRELMLRNNI